MDQIKTIAVTRASGTGRASRQARLRGYQVLCGNVTVVPVMAEVPENPKDRQRTIAVNKLVTNAPIGFPTYPAHAVGRHRPHPAGAEPPVSVK
jgi:hypothetical protein